MIDLLKSIAIGWVLLLAIGFLFRGMIFLIVWLPFGFLQSGEFWRVVIFFTIFTFAAAMIGYIVRLEWRYRNEGW